MRQPKQPPFTLHKYEPLLEALPEQWNDWKWQTKFSLKTKEAFKKHFQLSPQEDAGFEISKNTFKIQTPPYYASLADKVDANDPVRITFMPNAMEAEDGSQQQLDPLGENKNSPVKRIVHRYPDRALFLVTDICSLYCRYCTRKHFTGKDQAFISKTEYELALDYLKKKTSIREVILSGGDPLTLSNQKLATIFEDLYNIPHIELIRIGSRIPATLPMRIDSDLMSLFKEFKPIYFMTHFNHPNEVTELSAQKLEGLADNGVPVKNQMVLLNGVNNHPAIVQALSRRLLYFRAQPYYMFQCDPSRGTDHLRTPVPQSLEIQKQLWGRLSGLALPSLSLDIPSGGGKAGFTPNFLKSQTGNNYNFVGWDGVEETYISPDLSKTKEPKVSSVYAEEWHRLQTKSEWP